TVVDPHVVTGGPAQLLQPLRERGDAGRCFRIVGGQVHQHADAPRSVALLRARRKGPRHSSAAEQRYERAPLHSITSSARSRIPVGMVTPSALAALRLTTVSNAVACWTGRSAGFSPFTILPA